MKIFLTSGFLPKSNSCCCSLGRSKKKRLNSLQITILLFALTTLLNAQSANNFYGDNYNYKWECIGPPGGRVYELAINHQNPEIVFGGAEGGLFKSTDGGATSVLDTTFPFTSVPSISPLNPDLMFYAIYRTTNGGVSWDSMETGGGFYTFHPFDENIVYAINGSPGKNFIVSYNKGLNWDTLKIFTEPVNNLQSTAINKNLLFIKTSNKLFKSTDSGENWDTILTGLPGDVFETYVASSNDSLIYLITSFASQLGNPIKFYRSSDLGENWEVDSLQSLLQTSPVNVMQIVPDNSDIIYLARGDYLKPIPGDVLKSTDRGSSWIQKNTGLPTPYNRYLYALVINPIDPDNLYLGSYGWGVYKTINGAESWEWTNLTKAPVFSIYINESNPAIISACTIDEGVLKTTDGGSVWDSLRLNLPITVQRPFYKLASDPNNDNTAYITSQYGLFKTEDGWNNWSLTSLQGDFDHAVYEVSVHPNYSDSIYAGMIGWLNLKDLYRSTDEAISWTNLHLTNGEEGVIRVVFNPFNPDIIYVGALSKGIYKSIDRGTSWFIVNVGLKQTDPPFYELINSLEINESAPDILYSDNGGVVKSTNGGENWFRIDSTLFILEENIKVSRVAHINNNVYASSNNFAMGNNSNYYEGGLYVTFDEGLSWYKIGSFRIGTTGPGNIQPNPLNHDELFITTMAGIYKGVDTATSVETINDVPESLMLMQNFPNPFNSSTKISFRLEKEGLISIKIYNNLGKEVASVIEQTLNAGTHIVRWDGTNYSGESLPSGIYFYRLKAENYFETKKLMILR